MRQTASSRNVRYLNSHKPDSTPLRRHGWPWCKKFDAARGHLPFIVTVFIFVLVLALRSLAYPIKVRSIRFSPFALLHRSSRQTFLPQAPTSPTITDIGPPLAFTLRNTSIPGAGLNFPLRITISSAIPVPRESAIVFIVRESLTPAPGTPFPLPSNFQCAFSSPHGQTVKTPLANFRRGTRLPFKVTAIWRCPMPLLPRDALYPPAVIILGPDYNVVGNTTLRLLPPPPALTGGGVAACMKNIYNLTEKAPVVERYLRYYSSLGVSGFVIYYEDMGNAAEQAIAERLAALPGVSMMRLDPNLRKLSIAPLPERPKGPQVAKIQTFLQNDCVWRARYGVKFVMVQFDLDEMLVGTRDLNSELARLPKKAPGLYVKHRLARWPSVAFEAEGLEFSKESSEFPPTWGKSIVKPERIDVHWVHHPIDFEGHLRLAKWLKLVHFSVDHYVKYNGSKWEKWESYAETERKASDAARGSASKRYYKFMI